MSTSIIARKDFDDALRSRMMLAITAIFVFFTGVLTAAPGLFGDASEWTAAEALSIVVVPAEIIVPIVALVVGYMAIVGERQTGSAKILLGFPHSRRDIVAGKLLGRTGVVAVGIIVGFVVAAIAAVGLYGGFPARDFFALLGVTLFLGMTFVGFAVGTSAAVATRGKAMATVIGVFIVFNVMWDFVTSLVLYAATGNFFMEDPPTWFELLGSISPMTAYEGAARSVLDVSIGSAFGTSSSTAASASDPIFLQDWFGFVVLATWMLVPLAIGYVRFQRANLG